MDKPAIDQAIPDQTISEQPAIAQTAIDQATTSTGEYVVAEQLPPQKETSTTAAPYDQSDDSRIPDATSTPIPQPSSSAPQGLSAVHSRTPDAMSKLALRLSLLNPVTASPRTLGTTSMLATDPLSTARSAGSGPDAVLPRPSQPAIDQPTTSTANQRPSQPIFKPATPTVPPLSLESTPDQPTTPTATSPSPQPTSNHSATHTVPLTSTQPTLRQLATPTANMFSPQPITHEGDFIVTKKKRQQLREPLSVTEPLTLHEDAVRSSGDSLSDQEREAYHAEVDEAVRWNTFRIGQVLKEHMVFISDKHNVHEEEYQLAWAQAGDSHNSYKTNEHLRQARRVRDLSHERPGAPRRCQVSGAHQRLLHHSEVLRCV